MLSIGSVNAGNPGQTFQTAEATLAFALLTSVPKDSVLVLVHAWVDLTIGASTTQINLTLKRGQNTSGLQVATGSHTVVAGNRVLLSITAVDVLTSVGQIAYNLTGAGVGSSANNTINTALIAMLFLQ